MVMPMKIRVGLCRRVGDAACGSRGAHIQIEVEVDPEQVQEPAQLQERIRQLFRLVRSSLAEELEQGGQRPNGPAVSPADPPPASPAPPGRPVGGGGARPASQAQVKAIYALARRHRLDLAQFLRERCQGRRPEELTLLQASAIIDDLKQLAGPDG
jgi:hypothetical protein